MQWNSKVSQSVAMNEQLFWDRMPVDETHSLHIHICIIAELWYEILNLFQTYKFMNSGLVLYTICNK